ncbi:unnamed protein product, partial [Larinioides sclopetarius]
MGKKENSKKDNSKTQAERASHLSFHPYVSWKPAEGNWINYGFHFEIPFSSIRYVQLCTFQTALIGFLLIGRYLFLKDLRSIANLTSENVTRAQEIAHAASEAVTRAQEVAQAASEAVTRAQEVAQA